MAFGFKAMPSRRYVYHCRKVNRAAAVVIFSQMRLAHDLQNNLVKIERERREKVRAAAVAASPDLEKLEAEIASLKEEYEQLKVSLGAARSAANSKKAGKEVAAELKRVGSDLKATTALAKEARHLAYGTEQAVAEIAGIDEEYEGRKTVARTDAVALGLYWATSCEVMGRVKRTGRPPNPKRWVGEGSVSIQFQSKAAKGAARQPVMNKDGTPRMGRGGKPMTAPLTKASRSVDKLFQPNTMLQLSWRSATPHSGRQADRWVDVKWRINSDDDGEPIWVSVGPIKMHRDIPPDADVSWAHLYARRFGTKTRWEIQFVVARSQWEPKPRASSGTVAVALGWRYMDGELRVGSWIGTDGRSGDIVFPEHRFGRWKHADHLQSRRDDQCNRMKLALRMMLDKPRETPLPKEFIEQTSELDKWKSSRRFAYLVNWWRANRFPGDELDFERFDGVLVPSSDPQKRPSYSRDSVRQENHLYDWMMFEKRKARRWRKHLYQNLAAKFALRYKNVAVAEIDWAKLGVSLPPEEKGDKQEVSKTNKAIASAGQFREILESRMDPVRIDPAGITIECAECGSICPSPGAGRWVDCPKCAGQIDRARNAAKNLLKRATGQVVIQ